MADVPPTTVVAARPTARPTAPANEPPVGPGRGSARDTAARASHSRRGRHSGGCAHHHPAASALAAPVAQPGGQEGRPHAHARWRPPPGLRPEQLRAQQVASLLGQGEAALAAGQFDQAIGHFDEVLRLEAGNDKATADRASAVSLRDASRKKFVAGRTVVKTEKASGGGLAGFEGAEVQRTPDFSGRIEFEMSPASGLRTGDAWTLKFYLVNDGKKGIKIGGITATTNVNGTGAGGPVASSHPRGGAPAARAAGPAHGLLARGHHHLEPPTSSSPPTRATASRTP